MAEQSQHDMFPLGEDTTPYRKLTGDHVGTAKFNGDTVLTVAAPALTMLSDRKSTRLNSSHIQKSRMPSSA